MIQVSLDTSFLIVPCITQPFSGLRYLRALPPLTRLRPDFRSCFLRGLRFSDARSRTVFLFF